MPDQADRLRQLVRLARAHEPPEVQASRPTGRWGWLGRPTRGRKTRDHAPQTVTNPVLSLTRPK